VWANHLLTRANPAQLDGILSTVRNRRAVASATDALSAAIRNESVKTLALRVSHVPEGATLRAVTGKGWQVRASRVLLANILLMVKNKSLKLCVSFAVLVGTLSVVRLKFQSMSAWPAKRGNIRLMVKVKRPKMCASRAKLARSQTSFRRRSQTKIFATNARRVDIWMKKERTIVSPAKEQQFPDSNTV
jgi:hypothetical protein